MAVQLGGGGGGGGRESLSEINVTPLVDVMLVMLVIFMVTAPMLSASKVKVKLPPVDTGDTLELSDRDVVFVVERDRKIRFFNCPTCKHMTIATMVPMLRDNPKIKDVKQVYLYGDQRIKVRFVLQVMARLREAGVAHVGLVTDPAGLKLDNKKKQP